ncbi:MAG TPA: hypothetical protein VNO55_13640, partial [Polyangia bacterium]|nr:hypothetical protein [Polyangia bacterium]
RRWVWQASVDPTPNDAGRCLSPAKVSPQTSGGFLYLTFDDQVVELDVSQLGLRQRGPLAIGLWRIQPGGRERTLADDPAAGRLRWSALQSFRIANLSTQNADGEGSTPWWQPRVIGWRPGRESLEFSFEVADYPESSVQSVGAF